MSKNNCQCATAINEEQYRQLDKIIDEYKNEPGALIQVLHKAQQLIGYLPREVQVRIANGLDIPLATVYGVVSFYSLFTTKPKGRHKISVCAGTACYVRGAKQLLSRLHEDLDLRPGSTTSDGKFSLDVVRCLGACGLGPVMTVDEDVYGRQKPDKVMEILNAYE